MTLDTVRTVPERSSPDDRATAHADGSPTLSPRVIEVSDRRLEQVAEYVDDAEREVRFERRGDRTYLVA